MSSSFLKSTFDGANGSGKTGTAARLAVGIAIEYCNGASVLVADSEERWRFLKPTIFDVEKVPLIIMPGKSLVDVQAAINQVEKRAAGVFVDDQLTTPWMEGIREFSYKDGTMPFARRQQLMNQWEPIVNRFRYGQFHAIFCGRLGYHWSKVEDPESGRMELEQGDSKFNAGGGQNFGYEADLELEMRRRKKLVSIADKLLRRKTAVEHLCDVVKDAASGIINGQQFIFESTQGLYKRGDYKPVLEAFRPYLDFMLKVEAPIEPTSSSANLVVSGKTPWGANITERANLLEEIEGHLGFCFPGGEGKSKMADMFRKLTIEYLTGSVSWARMADEAPIDELGKYKYIIMAMRKRIEAKQVPNTQPELQALLDLATDDVHGGAGKSMTLLEVMGLRSVEAVKANGKGKGPQPVVAMMDREREVAGD